MNKNQLITENNGYEQKEYTPNNKAKKLIASILAVTAGVSAVAVTSAVVFHDIFFSRYERPDYNIYPGEYCYDRVSSRLQREEFYFLSGENHLKGYFYPANNSKGIVVIAHGIHAGADDYIPLIEYVVNDEFSVFSFDYTGTYDSEGESTVGMCQSLIDLHSALNYIKSNKKYSGQPLFLIGHSWGGYAVTSVLALHRDITACVGIAPMNDGANMMIEKASEHVGIIAQLPKPVFDTHQRLLFGNFVEYNGVKGINSVDCPVLIAQGLTDDVITYNGTSITAKKNEITNPNVIYYDGVGTFGDHNNIWHSQQSALYQEQIRKDILRLEQLKGKKLTYQEMVNYYKTVDHALYSEVNKELMDLILSTFNGALNK